MLASILVAVALVQQRCVDCTLVDVKVRLCSAHAEEEHSTFNGTRKGFASKVDAERIGALDALARLTDRHPNAPSERVVRRIAEALDDESPAVRERAARLLGPPQNALVAMEALLDALAKVEKELRKRVGDAEELQKRRMRAGLGSKQWNELGSDLEQNAMAQESTLAWRRVVLTQLGYFADERIAQVLRDNVRAIVAALAKAKEIDDVYEAFGALRAARERLPGAMDVNAPLVRVGSREAVRTVIANLTVLQAEITELEGARATSDSSLPGLRDMIESMFRQLRDAGERTAQEILSVLAEKGLEAELPPPIAPSTVLDMLQRHLGSFPEQLPGVVSPAW